MGVAKSNLWMLVALAVLLLIVLPVNGNEMPTRSRVGWAICSVVFLNLNGLVLPLGALIAIPAALRARSYFRILGNDVTMRNFPSPTQHFERSAVQRVQFTAGGKEVELVLADRPPLKSTGLRGAEAGVLTQINNVLITPVA